MNWKEIEKKRLTVNTLNLTIKAIRVDDKAFTVTLFNQLPYKDFSVLCLEESLKISYDNKTITTDNTHIDIIGYVKQKSFFLLGIEKGKLCRIEIIDDGWRHHAMKLIKMLEQLFIGV